MTENKNKQSKDQTISSKDNPLFKKLKLLLSAKGIKEHQLFFLMGEKLINEYLKEKNKSYKIHLYITCEKFHVKRPFRTLFLSQDLFNELDTIGTHHPLLVLELNSFPTLDQLPEVKNCEVVLPLGDPRNLGAVLRSAVAFNFNKIYLTKESCHPFLPNSIKASAGAVLKSEFYLLNCSFHDLKPKDNDYGLDLEGQPIQTMTWSKNVRIWIGEEGPGLKSDKLKKLNKIKIPTENVESLNASVSAAISFWEILKSRF